MSQRKKPGSRSGSNQKSRRQLWQKGGGLGKALRPIVILGLVLLLVGWLLNLSGLASLRGNTPVQASLPLRISEVQSNNRDTLIAADGSAPDWIEIENYGDAAVSLKGVTLAVDKKINKVLVFPEVTLNAGEYLLVHADGKTCVSKGGVLHAPFKLNASGGSTLFLISVDGNLLDSVEAPEMDDDCSYSRIDGEWEICLIATPGAENRAAAASETIEVEIHDGAVEISEAMSSNSVYFPDENGECCDYIELHNTTDADVNLKGYWLSDSAVRLKKWQLPDVTLPAGGYLALHCSGYDRTEDPNHLHTNFKLSRSGERVFLSEPDGMAISTVDLPLLEKGQACSLENGRWTTSLAPTPNLENSARSAVQTQVDSLSGITVRINEVMAAPLDGGADWIEIYNTGSQSIDLSNCGFSNDLSHPRKWQFPAGTTLGPQEYLVVFCAGSDAPQQSGYLCAPFSFSASGGYSLCLSTPGGQIFDALYIPVQVGGITYGRSDSGQCGYLPAATPLAANGSMYYESRAENAQYSVPGGLFTSGQSFSVSLSAESGARIYYTLDCSDPSESSTLYTGTPIPVSSNTILRTRVYKDGCLPSLMDTQSYLFDVQGASGTPYVISLVSDPTGLFGYETGIMVMGPNATDKFPYGAYGQGANFWMDWERESHIEFFTGAGEQVLSQECGIKIHGRNSRAYEIKGFKLIARARYGDSMFRYPIFSDRDADAFSTLLLRYTGQDYKSAFMRDPVLTSLAANTSVLYQEAEECIVYLNGEYYSAMYVREHMNTDAICRQLGWEGREDAIDLVAGSAIVRQGSNDTFAALEEYLKTHDVTTQEAYERIDSIVDIDNFIEYCSMQLVIGTYDTINVKRYRDPEGDGKWRWIIYDVDRSMREDLDSFDILSGGNYGTLFKSCMQNPTIRERFLVYFNQALATYMSPQSMFDMIQAQYQRLQPVLPQYLDMIGVTRSEYDANVKNFANRATKRSGEIIQHCSNYLKLSSEETNRYFADALAAIEAYNSKS